MVATRLSRRELLACTLSRQHLLRRDATRLEVASDLCGLQAQFATGPRDALLLRASDFSREGWERGLVKAWTLRGTIHVVPESELGLHLSARDRRGPLDEAWHGWGIPTSELGRWSEFIRDRVASGVCDREGLKASCREAGMSEWLLGRVFNGWGGLPKEMCDRGLLAYEAGTAKRFVVPPEPTWVGRDEARAELVRRYFLHFGPATYADCAGFLGVPAGEAARLARRAALPLREASCDGTDLLYLGELDAGARVPGCVLLAGFDQAVLGYRDRSRLMGDEARRHVTNRAGIVFPVVLWRGRARARWRLSGRRVTVTEFSCHAPLSETARAGIASRARRLLAPACPPATRTRGVDVAFQGEDALPEPRPFSLETLPSELRRAARPDGD